MSMDQTFSVDAQRYAEIPQKPLAAPTFNIKQEARDRIFKARVDLLAEGKCFETGYIKAEDTWEKIPKGDRLAIMGMLMADVHAGKDLRKARYPIPSLKAAVTIDTSEMVELFQQVIGELSAPMRFGEMLLMKENFKDNSGSVVGRVASAVAEDYIHEQKISNGPYKQVASMWEYATYEIKQAGIEVAMDNWDLAKLPWDELGRQMRLMANGAARTINLTVYKAFYDAYGSGTRPFTDLENIGGTGASALTTIDSSDTTPYTGVSRTNGDIIYYDYLRARQKIMSRPNALDMSYIVVAPVQWERMEYWNVSQKTAFARVMGRNGQSFQTLPGYDGRVIPVTVLVDDDLAESDFQVNSKNIALYVGPGEFVGRYIEDEPPTMLAEFDKRTNSQILVSRLACAAVISNYNSWVFQYNLLTSY